MLEHEVEWPTLVFFMALFIVIAGAESTGLIQFIAEWVGDVSGGSLTVAIIMVLWVSAIASAFIDNIPFTATMLPIVAFLNQTIPWPRSSQGCSARDNYRATCPYFRTVFFLPWLESPNQYPGEYRACWLPDPNSAGPADKRG